jgi:hypothetical protein
MALSLSGEDPWDPRVLDGVRRGPVGPPGPPELAALPRAVGRLARPEALAVDDGPDPGVVERLAGLGRHPLATAKVVLGPTLGRQKLDPKVSLQWPRFANF